MVSLLRCVFHLVLLLVEIGNNGKNRRLKKNQTETRRREDQDGKKREQGEDWRYVDTQYVERGVSHIVIAIYI